MASHSSKACGSTRLRESGAGVARGSASGTAADPTGGGAGESSFGSLQEGVLHGILMAVQDAQGLEIRVLHGDLATVFGGLEQGLIEILVETLDERCQCLANPVVACLHHSGAIRRIQCLVGIRRDGPVRGRLPGEFPDGFLEPLQGGEIRVDEGQPGAVAVGMYDAAPEVEVRRVPAGRQGTMHGDGFPDGQRHGGREADQQPPQAIIAHDARARSGTRNLKLRRQSRRFASKSATLTAVPAAATGRGFA